MRTRHFVFGGLLLIGVCGTVDLRAQDPSDEVRTATMRPVIRGRTQAAASMKPEATRAAERMLQAGGNAFDAAVAGQAVLGLVDAWYLLLDRWGTMTFAQVLQPAIEMAENGFPIGERMAGAIATSKKLKKYPTSVRVYFPGGE